MPVRVYARPCAPIVVCNMGQLNRGFLRGVDGASLLVGEFGLGMFLSYSSLLPAVCHHDLCLYHCFLRWYLVPCAPGYSSMACDRCAELGAMQGGHHDARSKPIDTPASSQLTPLYADWFVRCHTRQSDLVGSSGLTVHANNFGSVHNLQ